MSLSGQAGYQTDYYGFYTCWFYPGAATATLDFTPIDDLLVEGVETIIAQVSDPPSGEGSPEYAVGSGGPATVRIHDNDFPTVWISPGGDAAEAGGGGRWHEDEGTRGAFVVGRSGGLDQSLTVFIRGDSPNTTASGSDFDIAAFEATFAPGEASRTIEVIPYKDNLVEGRELVGAMLTGASSKCHIGTDRAQIGIADDPPVVTVTIDEYQDPASEDGPTEIRVLITRSGGDLTEPLPVEYIVSGTADASDYVVSDPNDGFGPDVIAYSITIVPVDDTLFEGEEEVVITVVPDGKDGYVVGEEYEAVVAITDGDLVGPRPRTRRQGGRAEERLGRREQRQRQLQLLRHQPGGRTPKHGPPLRQGRVRAGGRRERPRAGAGVGGGRALRPATSCG